MHIVIDPKNGNRNMITPAIPAISNPKRAETYKRMTMLCVTLVIPGTLQMGSKRYPTQYNHRCMTHVTDVAVTALSLRPS